MDRNATRLKKVTRWVLGAVWLVDLVLVAFIWQNTLSPRTSRLELQRVRQQHDLLAADLQRVRSIRQRLPEIQQECDRFFTEEFREASSGYSSVVANLSEIAKAAGLRTSSVNYRQRDLAGRGVLEVEVSATVEGDYPSLVRFINGLERSDNFYLLDNLALASSSSGTVKLNLLLKTYFRS